MNPLIFALTFLFLSYVCWCYFHSSTIAERIVGGGRANADAIVAAGYDVLPEPPRAAKASRLLAVLRTLGAGR